jgi:hypothetical protein
MAYTILKPVPIPEFSELSFDHCQFESHDHYQTPADSMVENFKSCWGDDDEPK